MTLLELDDAYQRFFEDVLAVNEDINISSVKMYIDKLNLSISSYLAAENNARRESFLREIRHTFRSIDNATRRNVIDLKRNVDDTYKQEPNFKIKELRLKDFDEKARLIGELIRQTERVIDEQTIFFSSAADYGLKQTVSEVRDGLRVCSRIDSHHCSDYRIPEPHRISEPTGEACATAEVSARPVHD